jgi:uncharacterized damage-inducible protein DinB
MKELLLQYAEYNVWANKLIIDAICQINASDLDREIVSSFPSVRATTYHTIGAELIWLQRLELLEHPYWFPDSFRDIFSEACIIWQNTSSDLERFVSSQRDAALTHKCEFSDRKGTPYKMPVCEILQHVFNHSTYHRGQLVTMLRQLGATKIPATDFIGFVRLKS